ncbi:MAG: hypothetical protein V2I48_08360 [Xanthomonadales bacterium]|nr:hypothetical protein [Xanthomonadales bacterium]
MRRLLYAVLLVSTAAIAYEILLMRMLSIVQWHHFAWMVISLALLGYGASGTAIAVGRRWLEPRFEEAFAASAFLFSVTMVVCWVLAQRVPFNALEVVWERRQLLLLGGMYLLFMVPFFFAAACIGLVFTFRGGMAGRVYLFDLLGAGAGALLVIAQLFAVRPSQALVLQSALALCAASIGPRRPAQRLVALTWAAALVAALPTGLLEPRLSEFKSLSRTLQIVDSRVVVERSSPLGLVTVVQSPRVPFRHAPGLSIATQHLPPEQLAVFRDGDGMSVISRWNGNAAPPAYLGDMTSALPYHLLNSPRVLVLGAGTGSDVLQALYHSASTVDAVELDPQMTRLARKPYADFSGGLFDRPEVRLHIGEARGFAARSRGRYDLVQIGLLDSFAVSGSGVQALNENYLYTVEAMREYLRLLEPGGVLAVTRWLKIPPRDSLKLVNTIARALRANGVAEPGARLAVIRGWNTVTLLVKNGPMDDSDIVAVKDFASRRSFDTVYYPSMPPDRANRYNRLDSPWFHEGVQALLGPGAREFERRYKFNIQAATDERPYFFNFFRWPVFFEALALRGRGGAALVEWGYLVPAATLVQAVLAGFLLILLPLLLARRRWPGGMGRRAGGYFFLLGLAFLFVEIAFIQKFTLFLSHPLYAVAVVLAGFLVFAGAGSGLSGLLAQKAAVMGRSPVHIAVAGIVVISLAYVLFLPSLFAAWIGFTDVARAGLSLLLIAPLALFMGMPFPLGLKQLAGKGPAFIPWAWGINGFASIISAALATLLAIEFGFTAVLLLALVFYVGAALLAPRL